LWYNIIQLGPKEIKAGIFVKNRPCRVSNMNAIVLAGGKATRFGSDKLKAVLRGQKIIDLVLDKLMGVFRQIIVVTNKDGEYSGLGVRVVEDVFQGIGPLGGLHAGLRASDTPQNFVVAGDMPCLNPDFIKYMVKEGEEAVEDWDILLPKVGARVEPLHGIYHKACVDVIEGMIHSSTLCHTGMGKETTRVAKDRTLSVQRLLGMMRVRYIEERVIRQFDPSLGMFLNVNTQEDIMEISNAFRP
jgi:molybdopterin-guanine dinucleotide biosynthesis protein A